jgi:AraC family transcriptional regulator
MPSIASLQAYRHLPATRTELCSWRAGWRSLLLRGYTDAPNADEFTIPASADPLIVLVTRGTCSIEASYNGRWQAARYGPGSIGMTPPDTEVRLRWQSNRRHDTLQLHLPAETVRQTYEELYGRDFAPSALVSKLRTNDDTIKNIVLSLANAASEGVPDLYAESAAQFLVHHLIVQHARIDERWCAEGEDRRLRDLDAFMLANLATQISLAAMAEHVQLSRFHLVRLAKTKHGETPFARLTRFRMEEAQRRLRYSRDSVTEIAYDCGYESVAHFATAFRRVVGASPSEFRRIFR